MSDASSDPRNAFKVVWIAGMARSGSMWAYNVARETLAQGGYRVFTRGDVPLPETQGRAFSIDAAIGWQNRRCAKAVMGRARAGEAACLKTHELIDRAFPQARFITTLRDVRGAALSFMRFNRCDFEQVVPVVGTMMTQADYYASFADGICLKLRYGDIVGRPAKTVARVSRFLNLDMSDEAIAAVARKFDRDEVRRIVAEADREARARSLRGETLGRDEVLPNMDGSKRIRHAGTGFQTNHITSRGADEWRSAFTPDQIARLNAVAGVWLERHGYSV